MRQRDKKILLLEDFLESKHHCTSCHICKKEFESTYCLSDMHTCINTKQGERVYVLSTVLVLLLSKVRKGISKSYPDPESIRLGGQDDGNYYSFTVTFTISTFLNGRSPLSVGTIAIVSTVSIHSITSQKTLCRPSSQEVSGA